MTPTPDPALVEAWLRGRSMLRGLPQPVADSGGLRVETRQTHELRRYVFVAPGDGLRRLAEEIAAPRVFLKLFGEAEVLAPLLPTRWAIQPPAFLMTCEAAMRPPAVRLPEGFRLRLVREQAGLTARVIARDGTVAASGRAGAWGGVWLYDQIVTACGHRRIGLGRAVMLGLARAAPEEGRQVLVATREGRALYETLGWAVRAPYTSAVIPDR